MIRCCLIVQFFFSFLSSLKLTRQNIAMKQKNEGGNRPTTLLSHHLSLTKSSAELSAMEKLLQDSVPCKIRAKRGCATHPRSIAERVKLTNDRNLQILLMLILLLS